MFVYILDKKSTDEADFTVFAIEDTCDGQMQLDN